MATYVATAAAIIAIAQKAKLAPKLEKTVDFILKMFPIIEKKYNKPIKVAKAVLKVLQLWGFGKGDDMVKMEIEKFVKTHGIKQLTGGSKKNGKGCACGKGSIQTGYSTGPSIQKASGGKQVTRTREAIRTPRLRPNVTITRTRSVERGGKSINI